VTRRSSGRGWGPSSWGGAGGFEPYVSVAERRAKAVNLARNATKRGEALDPVVIEGRAIARTHWGKAFADHLEKHCDQYNRLERGRRYAKNGSVVHLAVGSGCIDAKVMGSSLYTVTVEVVALPPARWRRIEEHARGKVASLLDLLAGRLPDELMRELANPDDGLFPRANEMSFRCSCPDYATMCKHVAAVLYGVAARADTRPELLFTMRGVDARSLISATSLDDIVASTTHANELADDEDLSALFGIELESSEAPAKNRSTAKAPRVDAKAVVARAPKKGAKKVAPNKASKKVAPKKGAKNVAPKKATKKVAPKKGAKNVAPKKATKKVAPKKGDSASSTRSASATPKTPEQAATMRPTETRRARGKAHDD